MLSNGDKEFHSKAAERKVVAFLCQMWGATFLHACHGPEYDACVLLPSGSQHTIEVKADVRAEETPNLYFEICNTWHNKPSGLRYTTADTWAHYVPHMQLVLCAPPEKILTYCDEKVCQTHPVWYEHLDMLCDKVHLSRRHCGQKNSQGYLVPQTKALRWKWPQRYRMG